MEINCDIGEGTLDEIEKDLGLMQHVQAINLACGFHAGNYRIMARIIDAAIESGVKIGAHPGYDDKEHFGRRFLEWETQGISELLQYQIGAIKCMVEARGGVLNHVKLHGALYNQAAKDPALAASIIETIVQIDPTLSLVCPDHSVLAGLATEHVSVDREFFADRRYDGYRLVSRQKQGVIHDIDEIKMNIRRLRSDHEIIDVHGKAYPLRCDTICVHGDHPLSMSVLKAVNEVLSEKD